MRHRIASYIALRTESVHFWPRAVTAVVERVRIASPMRARHRTVRVIRLLTLLGVVLAAGPASALRRCGDDVDGGAVPCACGDLLVGSHRLDAADPVTTADRKSTRLNSSHITISYAVVCSKKKKASL